MYKKIDQSEDYLREFMFYNQDYNEAMKRLNMSFAWLDVDRLNWMIELIEFQKYWIYKNQISFWDPKSKYQNDFNNIEIKWVFKTLDRFKNVISSNIPWNNVELDELTWMDKDALESILKQDFEERTKKMKDLIESVKKASEQIIDNWQNK